jgi:hypothetical protein
MGNMKKWVLFLLLVFSLATFAQNKDLKYFKISQKECLKKPGYTLVLKQVLSDSRCPEGVQCVWSGEAQVLVSVYKDKKLVEDVTIVLSQTKQEENKQWFAKYVAAKHKQVQSINLVPYPKSGVKVDAGDYYLKIGYVK